VPADSSASPDDLPESKSDDRLAGLESAEARRAEGERLDHRFELFEVILMSVAAVLVAWTGFQATKWSGVQANSFSAAGASRVEASQASTLAGQESVVDVVTFTQWLAALEDEGLLGAENREVGYVPDPDLVSGFLYQRFRDEFKVAVDAWVATRPLIDPAAPPTPFAMPEYQVAAADEADRLEQEADDFAAEARQANQRSDNYVLVTILFATVLFLAGVSSKMDTARARIVLLALASALLLVSSAVLIAFPKEI
jgi:hypothetical protein